MATVESMSIEIVQSFVNFAQKLMDLLAQFAMLPGSSDPEAIYSKRMVRAKFSVSMNRIYEAARKLEEHPEYIENGDNCLAPLRVWCDILREIPKNPRPYNPRKKRS
ncbi:hypothetical protein GYB59_00490 [bacterium]|nr:hypothetical protein [bacterium]